MLKFIGFIILSIGFFMLIHFGLGVAMAIAGRLVFFLLCAVLALIAAKKVVGK